ncbi:DUF4405 domain-containing protein [Pontiellaceae bacterium B12227]|nr:DUF4405 domain-containing protein [Pontiellaceae bacterium B12227]
MTFRKTTSLTTLLAFILLLFTSVILYVTPQGKIAFWANWNMLGLGKEEWGALHVNLGILFIVAGIVHTVLNWKPIVTYMKNKTQQLKVFTGDFNLALGITLFITLFTLFGLPPISGIQHFNESLKEAAAREYGEPPYGHAEASPLKAFCKRTGLDLNEAIQALEKANLKEVTEKTTLAQIATANNLTPQQVYNLIKPAPTSHSKGMPDHPGMGFGRKTVEEVCAEHSLDVDKMIKGLNGEGLEAKAGSTMKQIAENHDMDPHGVYEVMLQLQ